MPAGSSATAAKSAAFNLAGSAPTSKPHKTGRMSGTTLQQSQNQQIVGRLGGATMSDLDAYEQWKQAPNRHDPSRLQQWLENDPKQIARDNIGWDRIAPFIAIAIALLFLFLVYKARARIICAGEELIVSIGAVAIRSSRAARAALRRMIGKMRDRAGSNLE